MSAAMPLVIKGTEAEKTTIEGWLQQICSTVHVDKTTGTVDFTTMGPFATEYKSGCDCLRTLAGTGGRTVTIQPLPAETSTVPGTGRQPNPAVPGDKGEPDHAIGGYSGGLTVGGAGANGTSAAPGKGPDNKVGSDSTVYVDMSNNGGKGYPDDVTGPRPHPGGPMWLGLGHELTTGHAYHNATGTRDARDPERQAWISENTHRAEHPPLPQIPIPPARN
jgi:hypothetical protein